MTLAKMHKRIGKILPNLVTLVKSQGDVKE